MDRLRAMEVFVMVVSRGSFVRASEALDTSPANVTRYITELEAHLGTRLLNRSARTLSLTESGAAYYARGRYLLEAFADADAIAQQATIQPRGRLRVNVPVSFGIARLAPLWPVFMARYPDVELDIALIDGIVDIVEEGFDLAIRISRLPSGTHAARKLMTSRNVVCASPGYLAVHGAPDTPQDLKAHRCLGYTYARTAQAWQFVDSEQVPHTVTVRYRMHTNNGDTARAAALAGCGIIWQPTFLIGDDLRAGRLVPLLPGYRMPDIDVLAVYPSRRQLSANVRVMVDFLVAAFAGQAAQGNQAA
ncbi:LysR family transcriptional regulator [Schauerella aestuarii]|uniref:LysR family transcriptional regulator n=1 Tax=Schauerella aestuarii TaxID=2511204 RepID=UPI00136DBCA7|nr:LysR family transcriptional regulator [Achromobacter aestuarii]MYZ44397.1 LysR family transcriptional regulator [Achromobacter aestuarii]